jgi:hypothetical protein
VVLNRKLLLDASGEGRGNGSQYAKIAVRTESKCVLDAWAAGYGFGINAYADQLFVHYGYSRDRLTAAHKPRTPAVVIAPAIVTMCSVIGLLFSPVLPLIASLS